MDWQIGFTLAVVVAALAAMVREVAQPDLVMMAALALLAAFGILTPAEAFKGFSNQAVAAIGFLFVVSAALRETGALDITLGKLLGRARTVGSGSLRIGLPVAGLAAFLNNAPIVAMMTPAVIDWARRNQLSPSRFLIPLSYASILGSITTIIGTSNILTVSGLVIGAGMPAMGFFELAWVGLPVALIGLVYVIGVAPHLIPERISPGEDLGERRREYTTAMIVMPDCPLIRQSIEEAGLRQLPGLFLVEIERGNRVITPVAPDNTIFEGDRLVFAGVVSTIIDLQRIRGLVPAPDGSEPSVPLPEHRLAEAVVSSSSPLSGRSIRDSNFRTVYDAAIIGVHRNGVRVAGKIGEIVLRSGDTLLLQCAPGFMRAHRNSPDFFLVSELEEGIKPRYDRAGIALGILAVMVAAVTLGIQPISVAAFLAAGFLLLTRCINGQQARTSVNWSILIVIGASLGIATAMGTTGAAELVAHGLVALAGDTGPWVVLGVVYFATLLMAELLHHTAAVALMFPIAVASASQVDAEPRGFVMAVAIASCCAFASPVTYQTHLIVYGPGGYRFTDFVRVGIPLDLICAAVAIGLIPQIWSF